MLGLLMVQSRTLSLLRSEREESMQFSVGSPLPGRVYKKVASGFSTGQNGHGYGNLIRKHLFDKGGPH